MTQPVKFGLNVDPNTGGLPIAKRITAIADASGLDLVGVQDHPYNADFTDTLTLITWLAARTRHVHLFPNVANVPGPRHRPVARRRRPRAVQLVGAQADGWSVSAPYVPPDRLPELNQIITSAARDAGRDPAAITRLYNVMGLITPQDRDAFNGPVERWTETLTTLHTESQMNAFVFWPSGDRERQSRLFAEQVVPAVRESLTRLAPPP